MWRKAAPVGNGEIGGLVYGGVYKEIIAIIYGKLWWKRKPYLPVAQYSQTRNNLIIGGRIKHGIKTD